MMDIASVVGSRVRIKRSGAGFKGLCPFHAEKTPSLSVDPRTERWHCFGCGAGGDAIDFLMRLDGIGFRAAVDALGGELDKRLPDDTPPVSAVDPRGLLSSLWDLVEDAPWSSDVAGYLQGRGIDPDAAWIMGCRDWTTRMGRVQALIDSASEAEQEAAGLRSAGRHWAPLRGDITGVAIPVWRIGEAYPWRWRWRPIETRPGAPKSYSCFSAGAAVDFLGAAVPVRGREVCGTVGECYDVRVPTGSTLVMVEGEPDWLSAVEALNGRARVVGICGAPNRWRDAWPSLAAFRAQGVGHILVCVHAGKREGAGIGHGMELAEAVAVAAEQAGMTVSARLPEEGHDLNDIHREGGLGAWFAEALVPA